jgi:SHS2 domain-containing protein
MHEMTLPFEPIDHTADAGIQVYGQTLAELFANAARGMFSTLANLEMVKPVIGRQVIVSASDREALLVQWLADLNFLHLTQRELYCQFSIEKLNECDLVATVQGEAIDLNRHEIYTEIKAVTFHQLYIRHHHDRWEAQIIFDL